MVMENFKKIAGLFPENLFASHLYNMMQHSPAMLTRLVCHWACHGEYNSQRGPCLGSTMSTISVLCETSDKLNLVSNMFFLRYIFFYDTNGWGTDSIIATVCVQHWQWQHSQLKCLLYCQYNLGLLSTINIMVISCPCEWETIQFVTTTLLDLPIVYNNTWLSCITPTVC